QILRILVGGFAARHEKHVLLQRDGKLVFAEAGHRHGDAVVVFVSLCDVIGRPVVDALDAAGCLQRIDQTVEADARPEQGRKIESGSHSHILLEATWVQDCAAFWPAPPRSGSGAQSIWFLHFRVSRGWRQKISTAISDCWKLRTTPPSDELVGKMNGDLP